MNNFVFGAFVAFATIVLYELSSRTFKILRFRFLERRGLAAKIELPDGGKIKIYSNDPVQVRYMKEKFKEEAP